jgi:hypothetical protein
MQFSQLSNGPQPSRSHWSQELDLQQEVLSPQLITHQPHRPITFQSMVSQSVIEKSKEMTHLMETDEDLCPTDIVKVSNQDEEADLKVSSGSEIMDQEVKITTDDFTGEGQYERNNSRRY